MIGKKSREEGMKTIKRSREVRGKRKWERAVIQEGEEGNIRGEEEKRKGKRR